MNDIHSTAEIREALRAAANEFSDYCTTLPDEVYFRQPENKWSVAQQTKHLTKATRTGMLAFTLPVFIVRMVGGRPNRPSRSYDALVEKYKQKLVSGGKASKRYIPKPVPASIGKIKLLSHFKGMMYKMADAVQKRSGEKKLDRYIVPHPLLGKITLRELCYFTIHHAHHHLITVKQLVDSWQQK